MSEILKEFKAALYTLVNKIIFRRRIVEYIMGKVLRQYLTIEEFGERQVQYYVIDERFSDEDMQELVESEKGLTMESDILAFTEVSSEEIIYIAFSLHAILKYVEGENPIFAWLLIEDIAKHESFHARQYNYLLKKGGMEAVGRLSEYMQSVNYEENILEKGAWDFQLDNIEQDFSVYDRFICPEQFDV